MNHFGWTRRFAKEIDGRIWATSWERVCCAATAEACRQILAERDGEAYESRCVLPATMTPEATVRGET